MKLQNWQYGSLNIYNCKNDTTLNYFFEFILKNHQKITGDIVECGVFRGRSLLGIALALQRKKSKKLVYGFDSFSGFPRLCPKDHPSNFRSLFKQKRITKKHFETHKMFLNLQKTVFNEKNVLNFSSSKNFSSTSINELKRKINYLGLKNIRLVKGDFKITMTPRKPPFSIMAALVDCDLYESHQACLPFIWKRLVSRGYIFLDEYYSLKFPGARLAIDEFFADKTEKPQKHKCDKSGFERWYVQKK